MIQHQTQIKPDIQQGKASQNSVVFSIMLGIAGIAIGLFRIFSNF